MKCPNCNHEFEIKKRFVPPEIVEIEKYCIEKGYSVDAEKFHSYYESNGWKVGRNPMKSWQAAITTWRKNDFGGILKNGTESARDKRVREADEEARERLGILQRGVRSSPAIHQSRNECSGSRSMGETIIYNSDMEIDPLR